MIYTYIILTEGLASVLPCVMSPCIEETLSHLTPMCPIKTLHEFRHCLCPGFRFSNVFFSRSVDAKSVLCVFLMFYNPEYKNTSCHHIT